VDNNTEEKNAELLLGQFFKNTIFENKIFSVGGFVRDEIMGLKSKDLDLVVSSDGGSEEVVHALKSQLTNSVTNPHNLGNGFPIWQITFTDNVHFNNTEWKVKGAILEFADTQKESFPDQESRQRITSFGTLEEDVLRRDFTCNMLMRNITNGEILDLANGIEDIKNGILRSHPKADFDKILSDDPLRMLRLVRFQAKFGWEIRWSDLEVVIRNRERIKIISAERINAELTKIMEMGKLDKAVWFMKRTGLLEIIFPEVHAMIGVFHDLKQPFHKECKGEVFGHVMKVLSHAKPGVIPQMSALLHDIGKPPTRAEDENGRIRFSKHEPVGAEMAEVVLRRIKFDTSTIKRIVKLVEMHTDPHAFGRNNVGVEPSIKAVRKLIRKAGDALEDLLDLAEADCLGNEPLRNNVPDLRIRIKEVLEISPPIIAKPILNGHEVMSILNIKGGQIIGEIRKALIDLEDDFANDEKELTKEIAEEFVRNFKQDGEG
jgi:poly(A) polymerase